jgi:hypothetical protein
MCAQSTGVIPFSIVATCENPRHLPIELTASAA